MANDDKLDVYLNLVTSGASKALEGLGKSFNNTFKGLNVDLGKTAQGLSGMTSSLFSVKNAALAAGATILAYMGSKDVLKGAIEQENAINSVALALARTGQYSKQSLGDLENWASQLQKNSVYAGDEILKQTNLALAFGITKDQAKQVVEASIELSAATGKNLDESMSQVTRTLGGMAGQLGKLNPRIRQLSAAQLRNGEAAKILLEQYGGTAIGQINTYGGALQQNSNLFHDMLDEVGSLITKNPVVIEGIKALSESFSVLATYLNQNRESIITFINDGIVNLLNYAPQVGAFLKFVVSGFTIMAKSLSLASAGVGIIVQALLNFAPIKVLLDGLITTIGLVVGGISDLLSLLVKLPGVSDTLDAMGLSAQDLSKTLGDAAASAYGLSESVNVDKITGGIEKVNEFAFSIADGADEVKNNLNKAIDSGVEKAGKLAETVKKISLKGQVSIKVVNDETSSKKSIDSYQGLLETAFGGPNGAKIGGTLLSGIATGLKNGKEGARAMLSSLSGAAADAFLPGLGAAVGPLVDAFSMGPDAVRQMVKDFMGALPDLIANIIESIPVFIEELANQAPVIIDKLIEKAPDIITRLIEEAPRIITALALEAPKISLAIITGVWKAIQKVLGIGGDSKGKGITGKGGGSGVGGLLSTGPTNNGMVNAGLNVVTMGQSGLITKSYDEVKKFFKFASGGEVPSGFPNDTAPAKLSSGELVIDRSTNADLKKYLSSQGNGVAEALLVKVIKLLESPQVIQTAVKLNQREFANIMLQTSRTNQRTV